MDALPDDYRGWLLSRMEAVTLPVSHTVYHPRETPRHAHFLLSGVASVDTLLGDGNSMATGLLGCESLVEAVHLLGTAPVPTVAIMRISGTALRVPFAELRREMLSSEPLRCVLQQHIQEQILNLSQMVACHYFHDVTARLASCLLTVADRVGSPAFAITQEFLAEIIGVHRPTLTLAAGKLQRSRTIRYSRGHLELLSVTGLRETACECYGAVREIAAHRPRRHVFKTTPTSR